MFLRISQEKAGQVSKTPLEFSLKKEKAHTLILTEAETGFPEENSLSFTLEMGTGVNGWICKLVFLTQT